VKWFPSRVSEKMIGHGNTLSVKDGRVELRHFGKTVKDMTRRDFVREFPLLAAVLGMEILRKVKKNG
jgi:hypothetical protein